MALTGPFAAVACPGLIASLLAFANAEGPPLPEPEIVLLDSVRSSAQFSVKVLWMLDVDGQFGGVHGHVRIDHVRGEAVVDARIDANAVRMRRDGTEKWVKSDEFFNVARYPEIRFVSRPFPLSTLADGGDLAGSLSLRGFRGPVIFKLEPSTCARPAIDCAAEATGTIRRGTFGMRSRKGTLSDKVELRLGIWIDEGAARTDGG